MIIVKDDLEYSAYFRTNRRTQWRYATYAGRWESLDAAIAEVKDRLDGRHGEYYIEERGTDTAHTGKL